MKTPWISLILACIGGSGMALYIVGHFVTDDTCIMHVACKGMLCKIFTLILDGLWSGTPQHQWASQNSC